MNDDVSANGQASDPSSSEPTEGSIAAEKARRAQRRTPTGVRSADGRTAERPSHPPVAAALLMVGIVVVVFLLSYLSVR